MQIGIITFYKASNCGACLQAYALCEYLSQRGHQVRFIEHNVLHPLKSMIKRVAKRIVFFRWKEIPFLLRFYRTIRKTHQKFDTCSMREAEDLDLIIYGSDEMWNIKRRISYRHPVLFGGGIRNENKIAYAAALNGSTTDDFINNEYVYDLIKSFKGLSARDSASQKTLREAFHMPVERVVDPTLLLDREFYLAKAQAVDALPNRFILLYMYDVTSNDGDIVEKIKEFSKEKKLSVVSCYTPFPWCDQSIGVSPCELLDAFDKADYVITNTFHGIMFSTVFEKNFIISGVNNEKVKEAVSLFHYEGRVLAQAPDPISDIADNIPDYTVVRQIVAKERARSAAYLEAYTNGKRK